MLTGFIYALKTIMPLKNTLAYILYMNCKGKHFFLIPVLPMNKNKPIVINIGTLSFLSCRQSLIKTSWVSAQKGNLCACFKGG